jgi:hypothetical protein
MLYGEVDGAIVTLGVNASIEGNSDDTKGQLLNGNGSCSPTAT